MMGIASRVGAFDAFFLFDDTMCDFLRPLYSYSRELWDIFAWEVWDEGF